MPIALSNRVAYVILDGKVKVPAGVLKPGSVVYPEALLEESAVPERGSMAKTLSDARQRLGLLLHGVVGLLAMPRQ